MAKFTDYLKTIFWVLVVLQFAPPLFKSLKKQYAHALEAQTQVGLVTIKGEISDASKHVKYIKKYFEDKNIKAILLKIESPGGAAGSGEAIAHEIAYYKKEHPKPIITLTENICASAGYYIASSTDFIISPPSALVGSIGSCIPYQFKLKDFIEQYKISYNNFRAGEYKATTDPFVSTTPAGDAMLQSVVDDSYNSFIQHVAHHRASLSLEKAPEWANGRIFTGRQAFHLGLIDEIGFHSQAVKKLKELALITGEIEWVKPPKPGGIWNVLNGDIDDSDESLSTKLINSICVALENRYTGKLEVH